MPRKPLTPEQKAARREYQRQWVAANPDKVAEYNARHAPKARARASKWQKENAERVNAYNRAYREANYEAVRAREKTYAVTDAQARTDSSLKSSRKRAGVINPTAERKSGMCSMSACDYVGPLVFDHWHHGPKKGHFRGWLCDACNKALGGFKDNPALLRSAAEYIELHLGVGWPLDTGQPVG